MEKIEKIKDLGWMPLVTAVAALALLVGGGWYARQGGIYPSFSSQQEG